jgi:hypothetical protein
MLIQGCNDVSANLVQSLDRIVPAGIVVALNASWYDNLESQFAHRDVHRPTDRRAEASAV